MSLVPTPADAEAWHTLRAKHIGASEVAILFGAAPDYLPGIYALWQIKAGRIPRENVDNPRTRAGLALEDAITALAAEAEGWDTQPGQYASRDGLGATLDRIIAAPGPNDAGCDGPGVLELKNVDFLVHRRAWGTEPPLHILLQLQAQLAATGFTWGAVAALVGGNDVRVYRYAARPKLQAEILHRVRAFWRSVTEDRPPQPDGSDATYRALMVLEPEVEDEPADLTADNEAPILCAEYLQAAAAEKEAKGRKAEARNRLLDKLAGCRWAKVPGFRLSQAVLDEDKGYTITAADVGTVINSRAAGRRINVREVKA